MTQIIRNGLLPRGATRRLVTTRVRLPVQNDARTSDATPIDLKIVCAALQARVQAPRV